MWQNYEGISWKNCTKINTMKSKYFSTTLFSLNSLFLNLYFWMKQVFKFLPEALLPEAFSNYFWRGWNYLLKG